MANTCLVTKLQGTVSGDNLIKFGTLKLLISRKYLTLSENYVRVVVRYTGLTNSDTPTAKLDIPFKFNDVLYEAGSTVNLAPVLAAGHYNEIYFKISDIPVDGTYAYISHKYNINILGGTGTTVTCIMTPMELSYLSSLVNAMAIALEDGSISEMDCPLLESTPYIKTSISGSLADYLYPSKLKTIRVCYDTSFPVVKNDLMDFANLTTLNGNSNSAFVLNTNDFISLLSTLTKLNSVQASNSGASCDATTLAEGLKTAGVVSRTIEITLRNSQWGGTGTTNVKKTFTFDAQGDYVIS